VDATRVSNHAGGATAAVSYGSTGKQLLVAWAAAWRARGRPAGGAKAVGELGGDAWSGAGAGESLGQRGTRACSGAIARQRRRQRRKKKGGAGG
jgi:hypothetical protein